MFFKFDRDKRKQFNDRFLYLGVAVLFISTIFGATEAAVAGFIGGTIHNQRVLQMRCSINQFTNSMIEAVLWSVG